MTNNIIRPHIVTLAALGLALAMSVAAPVFAQTHHNRTTHEIGAGQRGHTRGPLFNSAPQQQPGPGCKVPLSPGGISTGGSSCGGPGYNPPPKY